MKRLLTIAVIAALAAQFACPAAARDVKNLQGADFAPGKLKLPLTVHERSGVAREGVVVTSGVPFPAGFLHDAGKLAVVDAAGKPVPSQATVMLKYHKPAHDDSVQWALVSFVCDVEASGTATYFLVDSGVKTPATKLAVTEAADTVTVNTGPAEFVVPRSGEALLSKASVDGKPVIDGKGLRATLKSGDWPDRGLKPGDELVANHETVTVEESGPVRVVVAVKGQYAPGDKEKKHYQSTTRLYFEAGRASVRVIHTIANSHIDPELKDDGKRHIFAWPIEDASLTADLALGGKASLRTQAGEQAASVEVDAEPVLVYQDSAGGTRWNQLGGGNYEKWLSKYTGGKHIRGVTLRGYKVTRQGKELGTGDAHPGTLDVSAGGAGVAVALRNFRLEYPSALAASAGQLRIGLFPAEFSEPFHLNIGQRKSWDVRLSLHGADAPDLDALHKTHDALLLFRPEPAWVVRAATDSAWPAGLAMTERKGGNPPLRRDTNKLDGIDLGWDWHGWIASFNSGGGHWNQSTAFAPWVLWGDGANFDDAEAHALWAGDLVALHFNEPDFAALWLWLIGWNDHEPRISRDFPPGYYNRDTWGLPDSGHMGMFMWPEYYFLTGDMRAREAVEHLGNRARAFLWRYNHDDRADGTGPMRGAVNWCRKQDPDADPDFKLATRYVGWPLYDLAQQYRFNGDPQLLAEAQTVARAFRNTARYSPVGFMVTQINDKDSKAVYGGQGPFEPYRSQSASQCYAHFQEGIMTTGLAEYYLMSRDVEALDAMVGFGDLMRHHAMLYDDDGKMAGWTYAYGDYWGPHTMQQLEGGRGATFFVSNFRVSQPMGWIYYFTGRSDFHGLLDYALTSDPRAGGFNVAAAQMAVRHPKVDGTPPAAIADLAAQPLDGGKVKLTWTAPGGDGVNGQAAWYQVKYHTGRLVERVEGWPDRSEPLPTNKKEWEAKAGLFNAKQRAFWSSMNVAGEPVPAAAGTKQSMVLEGLPSGTLNLAIKSWDAADNMSDLSNVAAVEVKQAE